MKNFLATTLSLFLLLLTQPGYSHHSVYGEFTRDKPLAFTGTLEKIEWVNPHVLIHIRDAGSGTVYRIEAQSPAALGRKDWHGDELAPGAAVEVAGAYLNVRDNSTLACCAHIYDADGYEYFTGYAEAGDRARGLKRKP